MLRPQFHLRSNPLPHQDACLIRTNLHLQSAVFMTRISSRSIGDCCARGKSGQPDLPLFASLCCGRRASLRNAFDGTIDSEYGGYSSAAERLTVAQDVVGSIPTSRPK
jgi:hypothetical protein